MPLTVSGLVHISSFLVMIIMSQFSRCQIFMQVFPALPENWRKINIVERINIPCEGIMFIVLESEASHSVTSGAHRLYSYTIYTRYIY